LLVIDFIIIIIIIIIILAADLFTLKRNNEPTIRSSNTGL